MTIVGNVYSGDDMINLSEIEPETAKYAKLLGNTCESVSTMLMDRRTIIIDKLRCCCFADETSCDQTGKH